MYLVGSEGSRIALKHGDNVLGRSRSKCDVVLTELPGLAQQHMRAVSGTHACISVSSTQNGPTATIRDLNSRAGTFYTLLSNSDALDEAKPVELNQTTGVKVTEEIPITERMSFTFGTLPVSFRLEMPIPNTQTATDDRPQSPTLLASTTATTGSQSSLDSTMSPADEGGSPHAIQAWDRQPVGSPLGVNGSIDNTLDAFRNNESEINEGRQRAACEILWRVMEIRAISKSNCALGT
jgi:hypothetical protein